MTAGEGDNRFVIASARNDVLIDAAGRQLIDLFAGTGAAALGHADAHVTRAVADQLERLSTTSQLACAVQAEARSAVESLIPGSLALYHFFSNGMEALETVLRLARLLTGRAGAAGFARAMHGKSLAATCLAWNNPDDARIDDYHRLPFVATHDESDILELVQARLESRSIAALVVEPVQGVGGGYRASDDFYRRLRELTRHTGTLLVFDEVLTGFYRTGPVFCFDALGFAPALVMIGKAMGNGFPVSAVLLNRALGPVDPPYGLTSTFSNNPLACAAVVATLQRMRRIEAPARVARIESVLRENFEPLRGVAVRLHGAFCVLEAPSASIAATVRRRAFEAGVHLSAAGSYIRLLPPYTIDPGRLRAAVQVVAGALSDELNSPAARRG